MIRFISFNNESFVSTGFEGAVGTRPPTVASSRVVLVNGSDASRGITITLGSGNDTVIGGGGTDTLSIPGSPAFQNAGRVVLVNGANASRSITITLGSGNDTVIGGGGTDTLGMPGSATLQDAGRGVLVNGANASRSITITLGSGNDTVIGGGGTDTLGMPGSATLQDAGRGVLVNGANASRGITITLGSGNDTVIGGGGTDTLGMPGSATLQDAGRGVLVNGANASRGITTTLGSGNDTVIGGGGTDTLGMPGSATLQDAGRGVLVNGANASRGITITLGSGDDIIVGGGCIDTLGMLAADPEMATCNRDLFTFMDYINLSSRAASSGVVTGTGDNTVTSSGRRISSGMPASDPKMAVVSRDGSLFPAIDYVDIAHSIVVRDHNQRSASASIIRGILNDKLAELFQNPTPETHDHCSVANKDIKCIGATTRPSISLKDRSLLLAHYKSFCASPEANLSDFGREGDNSASTTCFSLWLIAKRLPLPSRDLALGPPPRAQITTM